MKTDAERIFSKRVKSMVENTDFEESLNLRLKEEGLDEIPEFEFLKERRTQPIKAVNSRRLKIAGFLFAVFVVSGIMTVTINSDFVSAGKFQLNNFMFNAKNGFLTSDTLLSKTPTGAELLIENEEQIPIGKDYLKELKVPGFIPYGYTFSYLRIINNPQNEYEVTYVYENNLGDMIIITQEELTDHNWEMNLVGIEDEFYIDDVKIFHVPSVPSEYGSIYAFSEFEVIYISGSQELASLTKIFEKFQ